MSIWGATVITNLVSAIPYIGGDLVISIWGGFSVSNPTLNRFFSLHYLLPFLLSALILLHLNALHEHGSTNPLGINSNQDKIHFHPYFTSKDFYYFILFIIFFSFLVFYFPNYLGLLFMAVRFYEISNYYNAICWNNLYLYSTRIIITYLMFYSVKILYFGQSAGNHKGLLRDYMRYY